MFEYKGEVGVEIGGKEIVLRFDLKIYVQYCALQDLCEREKKKTDHNTR